ncbi:Glucanosyltransferase-domain-containing protein, partial [Limtongia smithiae]|uniref:Glucanosyltransferase-domain-containing protein n=1 Tax=Limtongia smithiae TaxID=1125753 RepID=UPI0034CD2777
MVRISCNSHCLYLSDQTAFFDSVTGDRFYIRGIDYQPPDETGATMDPLKDYDVCSRDIPYIKDLGMNTIRVYHVDNSVDHSECMQLLADNDMYLILDVPTAADEIDSDYPYDSYNAVLLQHNFATIDNFKNYTNLLGFVAANEVVNNVNNTDAATILKAVIRDMRAYIDAQSDRAIPVGYCAADVIENVYLLANYLNCGDDDTHAQFYGVNNYEWCGASSYTLSGYDQLVANFTGYSIPVFFSEYGCNTVEPRLFGEVKSIYSTQMSSVLSGGLVYEYVMEANDYGIANVTYGSDEVTLLTDYYNLQAQLNSTTDPDGDGGYLSNGTAATCPTYEAGTWEANNTLPAMPAKASKYLTDGAGAGLGMDGPSNLSTGVTSTITATSTSTSKKTTKTTASGSATATASGSEYSQVYTTSDPTSTSTTSTTSTS